MPSDIQTSNNAGNLTVFHSPNACSEGITLLLRKIGAPHEVHVVNVAKKEQLRPEFLAINPKGKVPALRRPDGSVLTEFPAIAMWLAKAYPDCCLIGKTPEDEIRALELTDFIVASLHMRAFTLLKLPQKFVADPNGQAELRNHGAVEVRKGLSRLSDQLGDKDWLLGWFSIADAAAYYVLRWAKQEDAVDLPENLRGLLDRLEQIK